MGHHGHRAVLAGTVAVAATASVIGAGTAAAADYSGTRDGNYQISRNRCQGISPNIVDNNYSGGISVTQFYREGLGKADIGISGSLSFWGYRNLITVRWTNLATHRSGTLRADIAATATSPGSYKTFRAVRTGSGTVRITLSAVNRNALISLPSTTCSDVFTIR